MLVTVPAFSTAAGASPPAAAEPAEVEGVPEPDEDAGTIPSEELARPSEGVPEPAPVEPTGETIEPSTTATPEVVPAPEPEPAAVDPTLLDAQEPETSAPVVASRPAARRGSSPEEQTEALDDADAARYRPPENPLRLNIAARVMFANMSGQDRVNGRMGGGSVDVGPSWNYVGVSGTLTGWAGSVRLPPDTGAELNGMFGGGLTLGLGRLALLSHGFLDLRLGYDVYYGVVNRRSDAPPILAPQADDPRVVAQFTQNLLPHGPRARLDIGLTGSDNRRFFHGFGLSMGYQALLGSFRGDLPLTNMLTVGISYWMG